MKSGEIITVLVILPVESVKPFVIVTQESIGALYYNTKIVDFSASNDTNVRVSVNPSNMATLPYLGSSIIGGVFII